MADQHHAATLSFILSELNLSEQDLRAQNIAAEELLAVYNDYVPRQPELNEIGELISKTLQKSGSVHTTKYRLKDPLHLLQKIIRKKKEYPNRNIDHLNYLDYINDLIGVRALHIYKNDWVQTGQFIFANWNLKRRAHAYTREEDGKDELKVLALNECKVITHPAGYSAVHFVIKTKPGKQRYYAEIQLRTLYEEAWSEIDHYLRYPNHEHSTLLDDLLQLLNKLTITTEQIASDTWDLARALHKPNTEQHTKAETIAKLRAHISKLHIAEAEKQKLYLGIDKLV
ncbi:RelA/SpoT domain-containing protein [Pontibacter sp. H259]|uniref:RelA/SpoT domain-containing protein n=1 Tax=Pontibacter sp. H259 TaxID=3133421 RepID=UPI0030C172BD